MTTNLRNCHVLPTKATSLDCSNLLFTQRTLPSLLKDPASMTLTTEVLEFLVKPSHSPAPILLCLNHLLNDLPDMPNLQLALENILPKRRTSPPTSRWISSACGCSITDISSPLVNRSARIFYLFHEIKQAQLKGDREPVGDTSVALYSAERPTRDHSLLLVAECRVRGESTQAGLV